MNSQDQFNLYQWTFIISLILMILVVFCFNYLFKTIGKIIDDLKKDFDSKFEKNKESIENLEKSVKDNHDKVVCMFDQIRKLINGLEDQIKDKELKDRIILNLMKKKSLTPLDVTANSQLNKTSSKLSFKNLTQKFRKNSK